MVHWPYHLEYWSREQIQRATKDMDWQHLRLEMKGMPTREKLQACADFLRRRGNDATARCCIDNYINALKRGGQLDMDLYVKKVL